MKRTTSFHLEADLLDEISEYQKKYNLSSRNVALERMILERRYLLRSQYYEEITNGNLEDGLEYINDYDLHDDE